MKRLNINNGAIERDSDSLETYLKEIQAGDFLSPEQETRCIKEYRFGNMQLLEVIVKANLPFVVSVAKHYQNQGLALADLISEGNIGLLKAIEKYDETKGFKFISYAIWWIRKSIIRALNEYSRIIRLPANQTNLLAKVTRTFKKLEQDFNQEPTLEELSQILGTKTNTIQNTLTCSAKPLSIDAPFSTDDTTSLLDIIENENAEIPGNEIEYTDSSHIEIRHLLSRLNLNQLQVVKMYYGMDDVEPMNFREISVKLNISKERARQIKHTALNKIRQNPAIRRTA
ncbi:MAG: RNA polymerase sigma factor RpoD/SigA [Bacteroidetes bacterium]|nr:RNA polymerase sigma factor RpoD/SigA [Bacteroidota bacterium]